MPIAVSAREEFDFTLAAETNEDGTPQEGATIFRLRPLTTVEYTSVFRQSGDALFASAQIAAKTGLLAWKNFKDAAGNEVRLIRRAGVVSDESINKLSPKDLVEIGAKIIEASQAKAEDLGK